MTQPPTQPTTQPTTEPHPCGGSGWRRVAYLNSFQGCPSAWRQITTPHTVCGRKSTSGSCEGVTYTTGSEQYNRVCGRITGYQIGSPEAFLGSGQSINSVYVNGVSIMRGSPRQHIWTFAGGVGEQNANIETMCLCVSGSTNDPEFPHLWARTTSTRQA